MVHVSDLAGCLLLLCFIVISCTWTENYGEETKKSKSLRIITPVDKSSTTSTTSSGSTSRSLLVILSDGFNRYNSAIRLLFTGI